MDFTVSVLKEKITSIHTYIPCDVASEGHHYGFVEVCFTCST